MKVYLLYETLFLRYLNRESFNQDDIDRFFMHHKNIVCRAFIRQYFIEWGGNDWVKVPKLKGRRIKPETHYISKDDVYKLAAGSDIRMGVGILILFEGGLRINELLRLKWSDVDFTRNRIKVFSSKMGQFKEIVISDYTKDILLKYMEFMFRNKKTDEKIFDIKIRRFEILLEKLGTEILGKHIHPHMLRHSAGNYLANDLDMPLDEVAMYLGHKKIDTTRIYAHKSKDKVLAKVQENL